MKPRLHHGCYELSQTTFEIMGGGLVILQYKYELSKSSRQMFQWKCGFFFTNVVVATTWSQIVDVEI